MSHNADVLGVMAVLHHDWVPDGCGTDIDFDVLVSGQHRAAWYIASALLTFSNLCSWMKIGVFSFDPPPTPPPPPPPSLTPQLKQKYSPEHYS